MRRITLVILMVAALGLAACEKNGAAREPGVENPICIASPSPEVAVTKVLLNDQQQAYVNAGNTFAIKSLQHLFEQRKRDLVFSPLSLQYALALILNGASGETATEMTHVLGYGNDTNTLNHYCNLLLNQLPALDLDVELKLTDAMMVREDFPVREAFRKTAETVYYAPVEYVSIQKTKDIVDRINEWAYRATNGFIFPFLNENDIDENFVATMLNALYFKAQWAYDGPKPMFDSEHTKQAQPFYLDGGGTGVADYMMASRHFRYGKLGDDGMVELPYANGKFAMYILLPHEKSGNGAARLLAALSAENWSKAMASMTSDALVHLRLPKFETENRLQLSGMLSAMGIRRAFQSGRAEFHNLFSHPHDKNFYLNAVEQKARIGVSEWGTEAAAVTAVTVSGELPAKDREVEFFADHPFVYVLAEKTSGIILYEGVYTGK